MQQEKVERLGFELRKDETKKGDMEAAQPCIASKLAVRRLFLLLLERRTRRVGEDMMSKKLEVQALGIHESKRHLGDPIGKFESQEAESAG